MTSQVASTLLLVGAEVLGLLREWLTRRRQEQAADLKPTADEVKGQIDGLVAEALAREAARKASSAPGAAGDSTARGSEQEHDELLQREVDHLVRDALARAAARHAGAVPAAGSPSSSTATRANADIDALRHELEQLLHDALLHAHHAAKPAGGSSTATGASVPPPGTPTGEADHDTGNK